jgi:hypothetical protein
MRLGLRRLAHGASAARALTICPNRPASADGEQKNSLLKNSKAKRGTSTGAANALWLALRSPARGEPDAGAFPGPVREEGEWRGALKTMSSTSTQKPEPKVLHSGQPPAC